MKRPRYRCPYCRCDLGAQPASRRCPDCSRIMNLPPGLAPRDPRERRRIREQLARETERERQKIAMRMPPRLGNRPAIVFPAIVVLSVLGVLLSLRGTRPDSRGAPNPPWLVADRELQTLSLALGRFHADTGRYPSAREGLRSLRIDPGLETWRGPYISHLRLDPWGQPYEYLPNNGGTPRLRSWGADRVPDSSEDLWADPLDLQPDPHWPSPPAPAPQPRSGIRID